MELHGAPGSQNGEMHSGCTTGPAQTSWLGLTVKPEHYWETPYNRHLALEAIDAIAKSCKEHASACWGIGALNEYERDKDESDLQGAWTGRATRGFSKLLEYLDGYYDDALRKARETLPLDVPVVLFSWDIDLWFWNAERFSEYKTFGKVVFDTHEYSSTDSSFRKIAAWQK